MTSKAKEFNKVRIIAEQIGMKVIPVSRKEQFSGNVVWDGECVRVRHNEPNNLCHEIAHFLIASDDRKYVVNYGLGIDYERGCAPLTLSEVDAQNEEELVCVLTILIMKKLDMDWVREWKMVNMEMNPYVIRRDIHELVNRGIIANTATLKPKVVELLEG